MTNHWDWADEVLAVREALARLPWWRWRKRRELQARARELEADAARLGVDVGVLFGRPGRLRIGVGDQASGS